MESRPPLGPRSLLVLAAVVPVAVVATLLAVATGTLDTALFFIGVPCLVAFLVGVLPTRSSAGTVFQVVTVVLLLVSAFLHEGALCVFLVSPLVYGAAFAVHGIVRGVQRASARYALGSLLVVLALEGVVPGLRISPHQSVDAERVVAPECAEFEEALARGPQFAEGDRVLALRLAQYPVPTAADGAGLEVGDTWELTMPAGSISTRVTAREESAAGGRIDFAVTHDGARTTRWVTLTDATLGWRQRDEGCVASVRLDYDRDLDPAFWFAPLTEFFMGAGASTFLAGLD